MPEYRTHERKRAREALLAATTPTPSSPSNPSNNQNQDAVLSEVLALRAIVLNLFYELAAGEQITVERMKEIIGRADAKKGQLKEKPNGGNGDGATNER